MALYYHCHACTADLYIEEDEKDQPVIRCPRCRELDAHLKGRTCRIALRGLTTNFTPHFDITQGQYFSSAEEKKEWLKKKDKVQVEGDFSPKGSSPGRYPCTKSQAKKFLAGKNLKKYIKNEDLHNKKIQIGWTRDRS